jgi:hypothetical protein
VDQRVGHLELDHPTKVDAGEGDDVGDGYTTCGQPFSVRQSPIQDLQRR